MKNLVDIFLLLESLWSLDKVEGIYKLSDVELDRFRRAIQENKYEAERVCEYLNAAGHRYLARAVRDMVEFNSD